MWKSKQIKTVIQMSMYRDHLFGWQTFFISLWRNATSASVHFVDTLQCYLWVSEFPVHSFNFLKKLQSKTFRSSETWEFGKLFQNLHFNLFLKRMGKNGLWKFWLDPFARLQLLNWRVDFKFHISYLMMGMALLGYEFGTTLETKGQMGSHVNL